MKLIGRRDSCAAFSLLCQIPGSHVLPNHGPKRPKHCQVLPYRRGLNQTPYNMGSVCLTLTCSTVQTYLYVNMRGKEPSNQSVPPPCSHCVGGSHSAPRQCSLITSGVCFLQVFPSSLCHFLSLHPSIEHFFATLLSFSLSLHSI